MERILILDDEAAACKVLKEFFEGESYTVFTSQNGENALKIVEKEKPGILLVDIRMPGMSGKEVVKKAREFDTDSLIIVLTAILDAGLKKELKSLGASEVLNKPINLMEVLKLVKQKLSS